MSCLCFVSPNITAKLFSEIRKKFEEYEKYFEYFEKVWIKGFSTDLWNYYYAAENFKDSFKLTNNILESSDATCPQDLQDFILVRKIRKIFFSHIKIVLQAISKEEIVNNFLK